MTSNKGAKVSYLLPYTIHSSIHHRFGVNKLCMDVQHGDLLYSAGRDGTIKCWDDSNGSHLQTCDKHTDWVNDLIQLNDILISASSDNTIRLWKRNENKKQLKHLITERAHGDYVKCLAAPHQFSNVFASGGLDCNVKIWDVERLTASQMVEEPDYTADILKPHRNSVYTMAMNATGNMLCTGSTDKFVRVFDLRSKQKTMKLRGHQDNVRSILMNPVGTRIISASSDGSIKLWDMRHQRCVQTFYIHEDSVWTLAYDPKQQDVFLSGGKDCNIYCVNTSTHETSHLLKSEHPILSLCPTPDRRSLWISTTDSSIEKWDYEARVKRTETMIVKSQLSSSFTLFPGSPLRKLSISKMSESAAASYPPTNSRSDESTSTNGTQAIQNKPQITIPGSPAITEYQILNNRRYVLAKDTSNYMTLWDITSGKLLENFGALEGTTIEEKANELFEMQAIPNWFSIETKLGCIEVVLDPSNCFSAEVHAIDAGFTFASPDDKVNMGYLTVKALFDDWIVKRRKFLDELQRQLDEEEADTSSTQNSSDEATNEQQDASASEKQDTESKDESQTEAPKKLNTQDSAEESKGAEEEQKPATEEKSETQTSKPDEQPPVAEQQQAEVAHHNPNPLSFNLPGDISVIVHHQKVHILAPPFRKKIQNLDGSSETSKQIPKWVVDVMLRGFADIKVVQQKISFYLESDDDGLPNLHQNNSKLTAPRLLRANKIAEHVVTKLNLKLPSRKVFNEMRDLYLQKQNLNPDIPSDDNNNSEVIPDDEPVRAEEYLKLFCNNKQLAPLHTLGVANKFFRDPRSSVITIHYRRRFPVKVT